MCHGCWRGQLIRHTLLVSEPLNCLVHPPFFLSTWGALRCPRMQLGAMEITGQQEITLAARHRFHVTLCVKNGADNIHVMISFDETAAVIRFFSLLLFTGGREREFHIFPSKASVQLTGHPHHIPPNMSGCQIFRDCCRSVQPGCSILLLARSRACDQAFDVAHHFFQR